MNNYQRALSGYSNSAGEINENLGSWRSDIDNVAAGNKAGLQKAVSDAYTKVDLDAIKGIGEEFGLRTAKEYGGQVLKAVADRTGLSGLDQRAGKFIEGKIRDATGRPVGDAGDVADSGEGVELGDMTGGSGGGGDLPSASPGEGAGDVVDSAAGDVADTDVFSGSRQGFRDFMNNFQTEDDDDLPRLDNGDIDFDTIDANRANASAVRSEPQTEQVAQNESSDVRNQAADNETKESDPVDDDVDATNPVDTLGDNVNSATQAAEDLGSDATDAAANATRAVSDSISSGIKGLAGAGDSAAGDVLEGAGAVLDATPFAPLGLLAQGVGALLEGGAIVQIGEGVANWFETDILGEKPKVNFKAMKAPPVPQTLESRGLLAMPTMDSNMDIPSTAGGW